MPSFKVLAGDCRTIMRIMAPDSVDAIVCDPPYHLTSIVKRFGKEGAAPAQYGRDGAFARVSRGFMGKTWDGGGVSFDPETWREAFRVLKPGGHIVAFAGSRTYHRMACAIEDAGFEIRDQIVHYYDSTRNERAFLDSLSEEQRRALAAVMEDRSPLGQLFWNHAQGFPKSRDISKAIDAEAGAEREVVGRRHDADKLSFGGKHKGWDRPWMKDDEALERCRSITAPATDAARQWQGWATALKPAHEPVVLARKPLAAGTVAGNVLEHGVGGLNIGACRVEGRERTEYGLKTARRSRGSTYGAPSASADFDSEKGRWPANVLHSGLTEGWARYFYCAKAGRSERWKHVVCRCLAQVIPPTHPVYHLKHCPLCGDAFKVTAHPTQKPENLVQYLSRLICPPSGTILDPFAGSGSTGCAAIAEGFNFIGIELDPIYVEIARARIAAALTKASASAPRRSPASRRPSKPEQPAPPQLALTLPCGGPTTRREAS